MRLERIPLVSIIVPVFKVEEYLDRCIKSLYLQTYCNLEIILVDDGSPDNCPQICDEWNKRDKRIKVIHKPNGGLSDARNIGLENATGDYIGFVDSDDYISNDFYETMLNVALENNSDIVECSVVKFYENGKREYYEDDSRVSNHPTIEALSGLINEDGFHQYVWNKLYKAETIKGIAFEVGKLNEDEFWTYQVFGNANIVSKINKTMYFYFQRSNSIMGGNYSIQRLDGLEGRWNRYKYVQEQYPSLVLQSKLDFFSSCIFSYQCSLKFLSGQERKRATSIIKEYVKRCKLSFKEINAEEGHQRKYLYLAKINMYLCCRLRNARGIGF